MAKKSTTNGNYRCSFCGKSQEEVKKLIAGPSAVSYTYLTLPTILLV